MPLPVLPASLTFDTAFPYTEGPSIEFKQANLEKLADTLCGFLNTDGGYYLVGIADDGKIIGINRKRLDIAIRTVDNILRTSQITNTETRESVTAAHIQCVTIPVIGHTSEKFVLAICAQAHGTDVWQLPHAIVRRLNASNWSIPTDRKSMRVELDSLKTRNGVLEDNIRRCVQELKAHKMAVGLEIDILKANSDMLLKMLYDKILSAKEEKEKELSERRSGLLAAICCGLM